MEETSLTTEDYYYIEASEKELRNEQTERFFATIRNGDMDGFKKIVKKTPKVAVSFNNLRESALHIAAHNNQPQMIAYLLENIPQDAKGLSADCFIDSRNFDGFSALMVAAEYNHPECVKEILKFNPRLDVVGYDYKRSVLHLAAQNDDAEIVEILLGLKDKDGNAKIDVNERCRENGEFHSFTPLHFAAYNMAHKVVPALLEAGADVNAVSFKGKTPLMVAFECGSEAVARQLMEAPELDILQEDFKGRDAYEYAAKNGFGDLADDLSIKRNLRELAQKRKIAKHNAPAIQEATKQSKQNTK